MKEDLIQNLKSKMEIVFEKPFIAWCIELVQKMIRLDFAGMAAEMAFWFILGTLPVLLFLMSFFAWLGQKMLFKPILEFIVYVAPHDVASLLLNTLEKIVVFKQGGLMAIISFFAMMALASNSVAVIMKGLNRAFDLPETRSFIKTRSISIGMLFLNMLVLLLAINIMIFGKMIMGFLLEYTQMTHLTYSIMMFLRWPVAFFLLYTVSFSCYYLLPDLDAPVSVKRDAALFGTLFFCIFWILGSWGFSLYLDNLNTYNKIFGTLGAFAIMVVWLYYTAMIILLGGEFNSRIFKKLYKKRVEDYEENHDFISESEHFQDDTDSQFMDD